MEIDSRYYFTEETVVTIFYPAELKAALSLCALVPASLLLATSALAQTNVIKDTVIGAGSPVDNYRVLNGANLTASNVKLLYLDVDRGSSATLENVQILPGISSAVGIGLQQAAITVRNTTVSTSGRAFIAAGGSQATMSDSVIEGGTIGAQVNSSVVELQRTTLNGTDNGSRGAEMLNGTLVATEKSVISGGTSGIRVSDYTTPGASRLVLDDSLVEGRDGAAIVVGRGNGRLASADIQVQNGALLRGSNGVLLEVADGADARLLVSGSDTRLDGNVVVNGNGSAAVTLEQAATFTGELRNVEQVAINSDAQWNLIGDTQASNVSLNGGNIRLGEAGSFYTLSMANLSGNGNFLMQANFDDDQADFLEITGQATGEHTLSITATGTDPKGDSRLHMVHAASGDASFSLAGGPVDLGAYSYDLVREDANDWYLDLTKRVVSPGAGTVLALFNSAPTVWYGELGILRSRMGEVRRDSASSGAWVRTFGNKYNVSAAGDVTYQQVQQGVSVGIDWPVADSGWLAGVMAGYSHSDVDLKQGASADIDSYHVGAYTTWTDPRSGYYFDAIARVNRYQNSADVRLSDGSKTKGNYENHGVGVAVEAGRHLRLEDDYFLEPFAQLSALVIEGKDYQLDNGMQAQGGTTRSLQAKLGSTVGRTFKASNGRTVQPYLRAAVVHEFADNNLVKVNDNRFNNDLSGTRGEVGGGVTLGWADKWQGHAEVEYSHGRKLEQPWGVNLGVRYNW